MYEMVYTYQTALHPGHLLREDFAAVRTVRLYLKHPGIFLRSLVQFWGQTTRSTTELSSVPRVSTSGESRFLLCFDDLRASLSPFLPPSTNTAVVIIVAIYTSVSGRLDTTLCDAPRRCDALFILPAERTRNTKQDFCSSESLNPSIFLNSQYSLPFSSGLDGISSRSPTKTETGRSPGHFRYKAPCHRHTSHPVTYNG